MNFTVDVGNTFIKTAIFLENKIIRQDVFHPNEISSITKLLASFPDIKKAIISSVRKDDHKIISFFEKNMTTSLIVLDEKTPIPIINKYESQQTLGNDRIALAVGANSLYPNENVLIVDCGTALTFDLVTDKNEYIGGNISPGIDTRLKALNQFTQKLPLVNKDGPLSLIGKKTNEAIRNGVINGITFEIDGYIQALKPELSIFKTILTGGDANFFDKKLKNTIFVVLNLIPIGLNRILEYNDR